ncbi:glutathione synthetase [Vibrio alfacsensis]|uniref:Glutathione synthetase n=1 Tax=Vibrio alfacsensis TaxID=1074311 RepID=A0ABN5PIF6_9VIBR|nr:SemiSWEET transporter [Vibrio alfacsensis]AXY01976.1 glutathione synthetase [Vibrio alfacsensis]
MINETILGYIAATCTTCAFIPQVMHILKTKDTSSISLGMYTIFILGVFLWMTYGFIVADLPVMLANAITLLLASIIWGIKIRHTLRRRKLTECED